MNQSMFNQYEIEKIVSKLMVVYNKAMLPFYKESLYDNFIDNQTFERNKTKIGIIVHNRQKVQQFLTKLIDKS